VDGPNPIGDELSPEVQAIMRLIQPLPPADRVTLRKKLEYQDAMNAHEAQEHLLRKLEEEQNRKCC
jgi:hypothetical protein